MNTNFNYTVMELTSFSDFFIDLIFKIVEKKKITTILYISLPWNVDYYYNWIGIINIPQGLLIIIRKTKKKEDHFIN